MREDPARPVLRQPVNRRRGEVGVIIDGQPQVLCLTLGALAELEDAFAADDVAALVARFGSGRLAARDLIRIIGAGLRGGGAAVDDMAVAEMRIDGGTAGAARIVAELLAAAFGEGEGTAAAAGPEHGGFAAARQAEADAGRAAGGKGTAQSGRPDVTGLDGDAPANP